MTDTPAPKVSIIVAFKDWGLERLCLSIRTIQQSLADVPHEILVSDFGSEDPVAVVRATSPLGARVVRTETDGTWSKSRALNVGLSHAAGDIIMASDADMLFTPAALHRVADRLEEDPKQLIILQCRDLPVGYSHDVVAERGFRWHEYRSCSTPRARWGMGGLVALTAESVERLRGWDERMHTYGVEDVDFGKRAQRAGLPITWLEDPDVRMYHVWHPSSSLAAKRSSAATQAIEHNRKVHTADNGWVRNLVQPEFLTRRLKPCVSVVIPACDDRADLGDLVATIELQTVSDIEILLMPCPAAEELVQSAESDRLKLAQPGASTMGQVADTCHGTFIAFAEPDRRWDPDRLEALIGEMEAGFNLVIDGTRRLITDDGSFIQDDVRYASADANSVLVRRDLLLGSDLAASDWHLLVGELLTSGTRFRRHGRARHSHLVPLANQERALVRDQRNLKHSAWRIANAGISLEWPMDDSPKKSSPPLLLTSELERSTSDVVTLRGAPQTVDRAWAALSDLGTQGWTFQSIMVSTPEGAPIMRTLRMAGQGLRARARIASTARSLGLALSAARAEGDALETPLIGITRSQHAMHAINPASPALWAVLQGAGEDIDVEKLGDVLAPHAVETYHRSVALGDSEQTTILAKLRSADLSYELLSTLAELDSQCDARFLRVSAEETSR